MIKVTWNGVKGLVNRYNFCGEDLKVGDEVGIWSNLERHIGYKGSMGVIKRIYFDHFWRYKTCYLRLFLPSFNKTIWVEADACAFGEGAWAFYAEDKAKEQLIS